MSVVFRSKQSYLQVAYETIFKCGTDITSLGKMFRHNGDGYFNENMSFHFPTTTYDKRNFIGTDEQWKQLQDQPDYKMVGRSYLFGAGEGCNELVLDDAQVIEAFRAYIATRADGLVVEVKR